MLRNENPVVTKSDGKLGFVYPVIALVSFIVATMETGT